MFRGPGAASTISLMRSSADVPDVKTTRVPPGVSKIPPPSWPSKTTVTPFWTEPWGRADSIHPRNACRWVSRDPVSKAPERRITLYPSTMKCKDMTYAPKDAQDKRHGEMDERHRERGLPRHVHPSEDRDRGRVPQPQTADRKGQGRKSDDHGNKDDKGHEPRPDPERAGRQIENDAESHVNEDRNDPHRDETGRTAPVGPSRLM